MRIKIRAPNTHTPSVASTCHSGVIATAARRGGRHPIAMPIVIEIDLDAEEIRFIRSDLNTSTYRERIPMFGETGLRNAATSERGNTRSRVLSGSI